MLPILSWIAMAFTSCGAGYWQHPASSRAGNHWTPEMQSTIRKATVSSDFHAQTQNGVSIRIVAVSRSQPGAGGIWSPDGGRTTTEETNRISKYLSVNNAVDPKSMTPNATDRFVWIELHGRADIWAVIDGVPADESDTLYGSIVSWRKILGISTLPTGREAWLEGAKFRGLDGKNVGDLLVGIAIGDSSPIPTKGLRIGRIMVDEKPSGDSSNGDVHRPLYGCTVQIEVPVDQAGRDLHLVGLDKNGGRVKDNSAEFFAPRQESDTPSWLSSTTLRTFHFASTKPMEVDRVRVTGRDIRWFVFENVRLIPRSPQ